MRTASEFRGAPGWLSWLVVLACFGPLTATWLIGMLMLPVWLAMLAVLWLAPERIAADSGASVWHIMTPIGCVLGGLIGLIGLVRVLTLPVGERPERHRVFTLGMVAVGFAALVTFNWPEGIGSFDFSVATLVYAALPAIGALWVLARSWKLLFASSR